MKISEKDIKLLLVVAIVAVIGLAWLGKSKIEENNLVLEAQVRELKTKYSDLKLKDLNRDDYEAKSKTNAKIYDGILKRYGNGLDQEHIIMTLKEAEDASGSWIKSATLAGVSSVYTFGNVTSSNPSRVGEKVYTSDYVGVSSTVNVNYEASYEGVKQLIQYINTYDTKTKINSMSMTYSEADDLVSGSMQLTTYGIVGSNREYEALKLKGLHIGTENIFNSTTFVPDSFDGEHGQMITVDYDIFLLLHAQSSDVDSIELGSSGDIDGDETVTANSNTEEKVTIRISGEKGNYKIGYKIGNETVPADNYAEGMDFYCGDTLDLLVVSSERTGTTDRVGVDLTIINNSDLTLNYKVIGDDEDDPRFNIDKVTGEVVGY